MIGGFTSLNGGNIPSQGLQLLLNTAYSATITKGYVNLAATGSGTSGTTTITAASTEADLVQPGEKLRIGGTDIYTVASVSTVTITTVETLTSTYVAAAMALDRVSQWNDKSGLGNNVTQATDLSKPVYNPAQLNSTAVLAFDGNNTLSIPSALWSIANGNSTTFIVTKRNSEGGTTRGVMALRITGTAFFLVAHDGTAGRIDFRNAASTIVNVDGGTNTNFNIVTARRNGTTQGLSVNHGAEVTNTSATSSSSIDAGVIGSGSSGTALIGQIRLIMIYNRALSDYEITQINKTISRETAIAIS